MHDNSLMYDNWLSYLYEILKHLFIQSKFSISKNYYVY